MKSFTGGVHPRDKKELSKNKKIEKPVLPQKVIIPVSQHIGRPAIPCVNIGDAIELGQLIAKADGFISANIHSSIAGKVSDICNYNHPGLGYGLSIIITADSNKNQEFIYSTKNDWQRYSAEELKTKISDAGIVGLGGAAFPAIVKFSPPPEKKIDTVIINGAECEPYLTADYRLMLEHSEKIVEGASIIKKILNIEKIYIGIEANKLDVYEIFKKTSNFLQPVLLKVKYPQGAEKQLIDAITGRRIPPGKLPMDVNVIVTNAGTVFSIFEAVVYNKPLIDRIVTVSGAGIQTPKNLLCRIGVLWNEIIKECDGMKPETKRLIMGGPMMGIAQFTDDLPVIKATAGILALTNDEVEYVEEEPCIRCGKCIRGCPMQLLPSELNKAMDRCDIERLYQLNLTDCIECGTCAYVCPANKKILQKIRKFKPRVMEWIKKNAGNK